MILQIIVACAIVYQASGHGRMMQPVARSSAWRFGFPTPKNYDDNALFCGGFNTRMSYGDKCGVCGDPWVSENAVRENEAGGKYATGVIVKTYNMGETITIKIDLTANHFGWMEYRICPNNDVKKRVTQECLDQHVLQRADGTGTKTMINDRITGMREMAYKLPKGMTCTQCVLQWKYHAGNSWGVDKDTGKACIGCGSQEEFYGCADVAIKNRGAAPKQTTQKPSLRPTQPPVVYTQPPVVHTQPPVITQAPWFRKTTQAPPVTTKEFIGMKLACRGINNWANDPLIDKWCTDNCAIGNCPVYACDCSGSQQLITNKPMTTQRPTTQKPSTTSTKPTTTSTTPTTTSTTPTTTSTLPTTTTTTPRPKTTKDPIVTEKPQQQIVERVECKAINNWEGDSYFDRVCADSCARGNCPTDTCKCTMVQKVISQTTATTLLPETTKPVTAPEPVTHARKVCHALGSFAGNEVFDIWCTNECNKGVCPEANCKCTEAKVQHPSTSTTTQKLVVTSLGKCVSSSRTGEYWNSWCQQTCDRGTCARDYCICGL